MFRKLEFDSLISRMNLLAVEEEELAETVTTLNMVTIISREGLKEHIPELLNQKTIVILQLIDKEDSYSSQLSGLTLCTEGKVYALNTGTNLPEDAVAEDLKELWQNENIQKVGHHIKEFITWLFKFNIELKGLVFDTMIAEYLIEPLRSSYPITGLSYKYLNRTIESLEGLQGTGKGKKKYSELSLEQLSSVSGQNARAIFDLWLQQKVIDDHQQTNCITVSSLVTVLATWNIRFPCGRRELAEFNQALASVSTQLKNNLHAGRRKLQH